MAQPPVPHTNPGLPDKFVVRSQISGNRIINVLAGLILFILAVMMLFFIVFLLSYDSYSRGYPIRGTLVLVPHRPLRDSAHPYLHLLQAPREQGKVVYTEQVAETTDEPNYVKALEALK